MHDQNDPNAIPTVREELERKVLDELVRLAHCVQVRRMEESEYHLAAKALWNVVSGLIPDDTLTLVATAADEFKGPIRRVHFFKEGDVMTFAWDPEKDGYAVVRRGLSHAKPATSTVKAARDDRAAALDKLFAALKKAGWTRL
jgi:hypothetical protein